MNMRARFSALAAGLVLLLTGCGHYTIVFEVGDVINTDPAAAEDDGTRQMLAVDIVCLTKEDAERYQEVVDRTILADEWFARRDGRKDPRIVIDAERIYALRPGESSTSDTRRGEALLSYRESGQRQVKVDIQHPQPFAAESRIVIYGRFRKGSGVNDVAPVVVKPPTWDHNILIKVGRTSMDLDKSW
jgi:hypothetical protein